MRMLIGGPIIDINIEYFQVPASEIQYDLESSNRKVLLSTEQRVCLDFELSSHDIVDYRYLGIPFQDLLGIDLHIKDSLRFLDIIPG